MHIILTGSSGLIGTSLKQALSARGHRITTLIRSHPTGSSERYWKPSQLVLDPHALEGADAVVHLAGASIAGARWTESRKRTIYRSRIDSTRLLVQRMHEMHQPPATFVCASAVGVYGDRGDERLTEDAAPGTGFLAEVCKDWEAEAAAADAHGIRTVMVRTGIVLSATGGALGQMLLPFKLGIGGTIASGEQYMSWVSLEDIVGIYVEAIENNGLSGPINATAPEPVKNREFTETLGRVLHRPTVFPVPKVAVKLAFGEMGERLLVEGARVIPKKLIEQSFAFRYTDLERCLREELGA